MLSDERETLQRAYKDKAGTIYFYYPSQNKGDNKNKGGRFVALYFNYTKYYNPEELTNVPGKILFAQYVNDKLHFQKYGRTYSLHSGVLVYYNTNVVLFEGDKVYVVHNFVGTDKDLVKSAFIIQHKIQASPRGLAPMGVNVDNFVEYIFVNTIRHDVVSCSIYMKHNDSLQCIQSKLPEIDVLYHLNFPKRSRHPSAETASGRRPEDKDMMYVLTRTGGLIYLSQDTVCFCGQLQKKITVSVELKGFLFKTDKNTMYGVLYTGFGVERMLRFNLDDDGCFMYPLDGLQLEASSADENKELQKSGICLMPNSIRILKIINVKSKTYVLLDTFFCFEIDSQKVNVRLLDERHRLKTLSEDPKCSIHKTIYNEDQVIFIYGDGAHQAEPSGDAPMKRILVFEEDKITQLPEKEIDMRVDQMTYDSKEKILRQFTAERFMEGVLGKEYTISVFK